MSMLFRQVAAGALAVAVFEAINQPQAPPAGDVHLHQVGLAFIGAFIIHEFAAGWQILWREVRSRSKRRGPAGYRRTPGADSR
jgi:hypothetical protein